MFKSYDNLIKNKVSLVLKCQGIIYLVIVIAYILEYIKGNRSLGYTITYLAIVCIPYIFIILVWKYGKVTPIQVEKLILVSYSIFYAYTLFTTTSSLSWIYLFPLCCLLTLFFDNFISVIFGFGFCVVINIIEVVINRNNYFSTSSGIVELEQRFACILLSYSFIIMCTNMFRSFTNIIKQVYEDNNIDPLSGMHNQDYIDSKITKMIDKNSSIEYTLVYFNIDNFKYFNDVFGHSYGDKILKLVANMINTGVSDIKPISNICRLVGDKYVILIQNRTCNEIQFIVERIKDSMSNLIIRKGNEEIFINISIAITDTRFSEHSYYALFNRASQIMIRGRKLGDNKLVIDNYNDEIAIKN